MEAMEELKSQGWHQFSIISFLAGQGVCVDGSGAHAVPQNLPCRALGPLHFHHTLMPWAGWG